MAPGAPDLQRVEQRINNRRERCSFSRTQNLIAKVMTGGNKADLRWVPYIYGQVHLARADALSDLQQQLSELDQAVEQIRQSRILSGQKLDAPVRVLELVNRYHATAEVLERCGQLVRTLEIQRYWGDYAL